MKRTHLFLSFFILALLISCDRNYKPRTQITIAIDTIAVQGTSIRAIELNSVNELIYAGSTGVIGKVDANGTISAIARLKKDTIIPHFRALAVQNEVIFALCVANPALLYRIDKNGEEIVYTEEHEKVFYDAMTFFDEKNGIAMGDPTDECLSIIITNNGGETWTKIDCEDLPPAFDGEAAFAASDTNIATYGSDVWIATGGMKARIFHSSDYGKSWEVFNTPIIQGKPTTGNYTVDFYDENQGIIAGGDYTDKFGNSANKAITSDGGKTWTLVGENELPKYVSCVQYIPETGGQEIIAVSTNGIFYSHDAGYNWSKVSEEGFYTIRIIDKNTAWLAGHEKIAKMKIQ